MLRTYLNNARRSLLKKPLNAIINAIGLVSAFAFTLLIAAFVWNETNVNASLKDVERQYLLHSEVTGITTAGLLAPTLAKEYPHLVENAFRFDGIQSAVSYADKKLSLASIIGDASFFAMFGFTLADGDANEALSKPDQVVLTHETAIQIFGTTEGLIGKQIEVSNFGNEKKLFHVSGVLAPYFENSVMELIDASHTQVIFPLEAVEFLGRQLDNWENPYIASYIKLKEGVQPEQLNGPIEQLLKTHLDAEQRQFLGETKLSKLSSYHLDKADGSIKKMLLTLSLIAGFILLMASVNFINISTNAAAKKLREIAVRKVLGANHWSLRLPILLEATMLVVGSFLLALSLYPLLSKWAVSIFGKPLPELIAFDTNFWLYAVGICLLIAAIAGIYPAFRLSALPTVNALKGKIRHPVENTLIKKGLVSFQFAITLTILICSVYIFSQIQLLYSNKLGYDKALMITVATPRNWTAEGLQQMSDVRDRLARNPAVASISLSYDVPTAMNSGIGAVQKNAASPQELASQFVYSDAYFTEAYKIPMLAGRFSDKSDGYKGVVINAMLANELGYEDAIQAVGNTIYIPSYGTDIAISGVTADFYGQSLHSPMVATIWLPMIARPMYRYFSIRLSSENTRQQLDLLEKEWKQIFPDAPFDYSFLDERLSVQYNTENRIKEAGVLATGLTMIIMLLGVFSLLAQRIELSVKAIGVRKVLGATAQQINGLFLREIAYLYLLALPVALAASYWIIHKC